MNATLALTTCATSWPQAMKDRGQPGLRSVRWAERARFHGAVPSRGDELEQVVSRDAEVRLDNGGRKREVDRDLLTVGSEEIDRSRLLVARVVAAQVVPLAVRHRDCVAADLIDGDVHHVHAHRVAGRE